LTRYRNLQLTEHKGNDRCGFLVEKCGSLQLGKRSIHVRWPVATDEEVISAITQFLILLWVISSTPLSEERQNVRLNVPRAWLQPESFGFET
jgi:hypothetical protein